MPIISGPNSDFATRLIDLRRKEGSTQEELASSIGTDKRSVSTYETGKVFPRERTLRRIAAHFGVDPFWLSHGHSEETLEYFENQKKAAIQRESQRPKQLEYLYIEELEQARFGSMHPVKQYNSEAKAKYQSCDISLFIPVTKTFFQNYRALRLPHSFAPESLYSKGVVIVIDENQTSINLLPSGTDVVFRLKGKENTPGIRKLVKEPGMPPLLVSLSNRKESYTLEINSLNVDILGTVIGINSNY
ncbi:helix-turn-helix domain-containing protein [Vibrio cholerae]|uniref:helix-turn-helix domain-containing protein n=1 Tax=Vibrio cholerae TaxID=666 RepID=UPI001483BFFF|nr:LexA family transcriptional regulator [Vibrio cholerae]